MELTAIVGLAIVAVCIVVLLRQYKPEYALMVSLICSVVIFAAVLGELIPAFDTIRSMMQQVQIDGQYLSLIHISPSPTTSPTWAPRWSPPSWARWFSRRYFPWRAPRSPARRWHRRRGGEPPLPIRERIFYECGHAQPAL